MILRSQNNDKIVSFADLLLMQDTLKGMVRTDYFIQTREGGMKRCYST